MPADKKRSERFLSYLNNSPEIKRVLFIRNGMIGDMTATTTVLNSLRESFPGLSIDVIAGPKSRTLFDHFPSVRNVFYFDYDYSVLSILKQIAFFTSLRRYRYDIVIVNELNTHFTLMSRLAGGKFTIGFDNKLSGLYDYAVERPKKVMALAENEILVGWIKNSSSPRTSLYLTAEELHDMEKMLLFSGIRKKEFVIVHPGSNLRNSDRQWDEAKWAGVISKLNEKYDLPVVFTGVKEDLPAIASITDKSGVNCLCLAGKTTLRQLMALTSLSRLVIAPDTGIVHMAAALDTPAIMLMGLSDPKDTGPYNPNGNLKICTAGLPCQPCVASNPKPRQWDECRSMRPVKCMQELSTETVFTAAGELLAAERTL